jgi:hypothetical protein
MGSIVYTHSSANDLLSAGSVAQDRGLVLRSV